MKRKATRVETRRARPEDVDADAIDIEASSYANVDWENLPTEQLELDPALVEAIRARRHLRSITLRVGEEQIAEARRVASETGEKYQAVMRRWLAQGASLARTKRVDRRKPARRSRR
jgi:hypothetical protein